MTGIKAKERAGAGRGGAEFSGTYNG